MTRRYALPPGHRACNETSAAWTTAHAATLPPNRRSKMAKMCPLDGCKAKSGLCGHDIMMIVMAVMGIAGAVAHWGLGII